IVSLRTSVRGESTSYSVRWHAREHRQAALRGNHLRARGSEELPSRRLLPESTFSASPSAGKLRLATLRAMPPSPARSQKRHYPPLPWHEEAGDGAEAVPLRHPSLAARSRAHARESKEARTSRVCVWRSSQPT